MINIQATPILNSHFNWQYSFYGKQLWYNNWEATVPITLRSHTHKKTYYYRNKIVNFIELLVVFYVSL